MPTEIDDYSGKNRRDEDSSLIESEARYRRLFEAARDGIWILDAETVTVVDVNPFLIELLGYTREEFLGKNIWELGFFKDIFADKASFLELQQKENLRYEHLPLETADGKLIEVEFVSYLFMVDKKKVIQCNIRDITESRKSIAELASSEARYRRLFEAARDGIWILDAETGMVVDVNPFLIELLGYSREEFLGKSIWELGFFKDVIANKASFQELQQKEYVRYEDLPLRTADGRRIEVEFVSYLYKVDDKKVIQCNIRDITERKKAEAELSSSEARYRRLFEAARDGIWILDAETGMVVDVNPFLIELLGYTREEFLGKSIWELGFFRDIIANKASFLELQQKEHVRYENLPLETADGRRIEVEFVSYLYKVDEKKVIQCNIRDITERIKAEVELRTLQERLAQAQRMESIGRLAGGVAHDFNNMLTIILGYAELLQSDLQDADSDLRLQIEEIYNAGVRAQGIVKQLLAFSRKQVLEVKIIDLNELITEFNKMLGRLMGEDIEIRLVLDENLATITADASQIEQVLLNLAVNARDAMPKGGILSIETSNVSLDEYYAQTHSPAVSGEFVQLSVSDTGIGMNTEIISHVFDPFFTTKEVGKGTGLGLSTVHGIISQHGGHVFVYSEPNMGTTFKCYLPRSIETPMKEGLPRQVPIAKGSETILVVEDDNSVRKLAELFLKKGGYSVLSAAGIEDALEQASKYGNIDLLLTDIVMPKASGKEVCDQLKVIQPNIKVLYMSGYTDDIIVSHGILEAGVNFISKPFTSPALLTKVRESLDK